MFGVEVKFRFRVRCMLVGVVRAHGARTKGWNSDERVFVVVKQEGKGLEWSVGVLGEWRFTSQSKGKSAGHSYGYCQGYR